MTKRADDLADMSDSFLMCRDKGHAWTHLTDKVTDATKAGRIREVARWWQCKSCGSEVQEIFDVPSFGIKSRRYNYPDGYLLATGLTGERPRVSDVRRIYFQRAGII